MAAALATAVCGLAVAQGGGGTGGSGGTQGRCPDQQATDVPEAQTTEGQTHTCGIGIVILGFGGGIGGDECPEVKITYPAHQKCTGETLEGHKCVVQAPLLVVREECECGGLVIPWIEVGVPAKCVCDKVDSDGTVEDFETKEC